jgi:integrase
MSGEIRCEILEQWRGPDGDNRPDSVETKDGVAELVVPSSQVISAEATFAENEQKVNDCEDRAKSDPEAVPATSINHLHRDMAAPVVDSKRRPIFGADFVLRSLRHTMLTRLGESGVDAFTIMRITGHSSIVISQRYVLHDGRGCRTRL